MVNVKSGLRRQRESSINLSTSTSSVAHAPLDSTITLVITLLVGGLCLHTTPYRWRIQAQLKCSRRLLNVLCYNSQLFKRCYWQQFKWETWLWNRVFNLRKSKILNSKWRINIFILKSLTFTIPFYCKHNFMRFCIQLLFYKPASLIFNEFKV